MLPKGGVSAVLGSITDPGHGPGNGLPVLSGDVWARVGVDGPERVYLHMVAEGARIALRELAAMIGAKGKGLVRDRRSRFGGMLTSCSGIR